MTQAEEPSEDQEAEQQAGEPAKQVMSFSELLSQHRKMVDAQFSKESPATRLEIAMAFFSAQVGYINAQMVAQALGLPEKQQLILALNEANENNGRLQKRLTQTEAAYSQLQKASQGVIGRGSR
jgi:hypothetical protein